MIKSESLAKIAPALVKAQKNMGVALKEAKNPFFKSKYADLNSIIDAALPALNAEGIAVIQSNTVIESSNQSVVQTILLHESGEYLASNTKIIVAKQNDPQAEGSAISYARRYGLQSMVTLKAADDDSEGAMGRGEANNTKSAIVAAKEETKVETKAEVKEEKQEVSAEIPVKKSGWAKPSNNKKQETKQSEDLF